VRVFLIGFMCSGKSRVGRELAPLLGLRFRDIDRVIEERIGPITPWVLREGEEAFRVQERAVLLEVLEEQDVLIACGGGTPLGDDNMDRMLAAGTVVYLDVPLDVLVERATRAGGDRPLLFGLKGEALRSRIEQLLTARVATYERAQLRIHAIDDPRTIAERIKAGLSVQEM